MSTLAIADIDARRKEMRPLAKDAKNRVNAACPQEAIADPAELCEMSAVLDANVGV